MVLKFFVLNPGCSYSAWNVGDSCLLCSKNSEADVVEWGGREDCITEKGRGMGEREKGRRKKRKVGELGESDFQAWRVTDCKSEVEISIFKGDAATERVLVS